ncbi:MAG: GC-type dockerin domain-anchored protein [Planctomycetota bacterium]
MIAHTTKLAGLSLASALIATSTAGQSTVSFEYQARVIAIDDPAGVFVGSGIEVGDPASGAFEIDLQATVREDLVDVFGSLFGDEFNYEIGTFAAEALDAQIGDNLFSTTAVQGQVIDGQLQAARTPPFALERRDRFYISGDTPLPPTAPEVGGTGFGRVSAIFQGDDNVFDTTGTNGVADIVLEELSSAEVTIEFNTPIDAEGIEPELAEVLGLVDRNTVTLELTSLSTQGQRVATLVCVADANENDEIDFGDFSAWVLYFNQRDARADANLDGVVTPADFTAWIRAYNEGC